MGFVLPTSGFVHWPVGTGDSTSICVDEDTVIQVDLHNLAAADDDDDDPRTPIVDRLVEVLPQRDGRPFLSLFVLTHPDKDHCQGFKDLRGKVTIGEIWFSPRIFRENNEDLCDDAKDFRKEAKRRVNKLVEKDTAESGDRVRLIGYSDLLEEDDYKGFPEEKMSIPGDLVTEIDGENREDLFSAFLHAPFKDDDLASERNETSVGMRIELINSEDEDVTGQILLLGDLSYPTLRRVWDESAAHDNEEMLTYDDFVSTHHCSKSAMHERNDEGKWKLKQDILDDLENSGNEEAYIIASSEPIPTSNKKGDNPPHAKAKTRYVEIVEDGHFICTGEHPDEDDPHPIVFELTADGLSYVEPAGDQEDEENDDESRPQSSTANSTAFSAAVNSASGRPSPPTERVGFGKNK